MGNLEHELKFAVTECCSVSECTRSCATPDEDLCDVHLEEMIEAMARDCGIDEHEYDDGSGK